MRAIAYRLRSALSRRWPAAVAGAAVVALVSAVVLTLAAGAKRTGDAPDAFTSWVGGEVHASVVQDFWSARTDEIAALPGVEAVDAVNFLFAAVVDQERPGAADAIGFAGTRSSQRLVAGREPDPSVPHEFVADQRFADSLGLELGDRLAFMTWTQEQVDNSEGFAGEPHGPTIDGRLVGIVVSAESLQNESPSALFSPALLEEDVGVGGAWMEVRLAPDTSVDELRAAVDSLDRSVPLHVAPGRIVSTEVRRAVNAQAQGTWLMAAVAAGAAVVALGQLLSRHARLPIGETAPLEAIGYSRRQRVLEGLGRAAVPAAAGVLVGVVVAAACSGLFPAGFVRPLDPARGLRLDAVVLAAGALALLLGILIWVALALVLGRTAPSPRTPSRSQSRIGDLVGRGAPEPAVATGARFALSGHARSGASVAGTIVALGVILAGVVGAATFAASLDRLVTDRGRFGGNYTAAVGEGTDLGPRQLRLALEDDPDIEGLMTLSSATVRSGDLTIGLVGVEHVRGGLGPALLGGRLPTGPDEVALGRLTAHDLGIGPGDTVDLAGPGGEGRFRVVGLTVVPTIGGIDGIGQGAVTTLDGLLRLEPNPSPNMAAFVLEPGAPANALERIGAVVGDEPGHQNLPSAIVNVARVRRIPAILTGLLVVLALLATVHALLVSLGGRRRDLAVLRALGADGRWIQRTVLSQATVLAIVPFALAVPLGVAGAVAVFRAFADRIGALPSPVVPLLLVAGLAFGFVVVANLAALAPARRARRLPTTQLLQGE